MKYIFKGIKQAHYYFGFPGSYRHGSVIINNLIVRTYSNGKKDLDKFITNNLFQYEIKNKKIRDAFLNNLEKSIPIHLFVKIEDLVVYFGKCKIIEVNNDIAIFEIKGSKFILEN